MEACEAGRGRAPFRRGGLSTGTPAPASGTFCAGAGQRLASLGRLDPTTYASAETVSRADSVVGFGNYNGPIIGAQTATWTAIESLYR